MSKIYHYIIFQYFQLYFLPLIDFEGGWGQCMVSQSFTLPSGSKLYRRNQGKISLIYPNDDNKSL